MIKSNLIFPMALDCFSDADLERDLYLDKSLEWGGDNPTIDGKDGKERYVISRPEAGNQDHLRQIVDLQQAAWPEGLALEPDWIEYNFENFPNLHVIVCDMRDGLNIVANNVVGRFNMPKGVGLDLNGFEWDEWFLGNDEDGNRYLNSNGNVVEGIDLAVHPEHRGQGLAKKMFMARLRIIAEEKRRAHQDPNQSNIEEVTNQFRNVFFGKYLLERGVDYLNTEIDPNLLRSMHEVYINEVLNGNRFDPVLSVGSYVRMRFGELFELIEPNAHWDDPESANYGSRYRSTKVIEAIEGLLV